MRMRLERMRLEEYHAAVVAHLKNRDIGVFNPQWWRVLGELLDAWGKASKDVARDLKAFEEDARGL